MPNTVNYLKNDLKAIEYLGYHKTGHSTVQNILAILMEANIEDLSCPSKFYRFDHCPFIWKGFHEKNYITVFGEDQRYKGIFNGRNSSGFIKVTLTYER